MEKTNFKSGFCGAAPDNDNVNIHSLSTLGKLRMLAYYGFRFLANPAYINSSWFDTLWGFASYYLIPHNYLFLFNHIKWDEKKIDALLTGQYGWEMAPDCSTTWRIGDGTAPFYNYIYYVAAGFTENDTLRSNQIREGDITREEGLEMVKRDNQPRYDAMKWYCDIIGINFVQALKVILKMPRLYGGKHNQG